MSGEANERVLTRVFCVRLVSDTTEQLLTHQPILRPRHAPQTGGCEVCPGEHYLPADSGEREAMTVYTHTHTHTHKQ